MKTLARRLATVLVVGLAAGCVARNLPESPVRAPQGLAVLVRGAGPDVVLVHGAAGDYRQWSDVSSVLSRDNRVIAVSRRFHWPNPAPGEGDVYTFDAQSADLDSLLRLLPSPAHLVAHSWGAGVALLTALRHPELVRSLTLIEPPFGSVVSPETPGFAGEIARRDSLITAIRSSVQSGAADRAVEQLINWVQGGSGAFHRLSVATQNQMLANAATMGPTFGSPAPRVTCDQLGALRLPVLVVRGEGTRLWYRLIAEATAHCIPGAETTVVPANHMSIVENPDAVARVVAGFIARH